jgi:hypothetical protein
MNLKKPNILIEKVFEKSGLGKWFNKESAGGEPGWDRYSTEGKKLGKCGDAEEGDPYSACLSKQKAEKLGKDGIASFVRRKRKAQKKAGRSKKGTSSRKGKKPVYVKTGATEIKETFDLFLAEATGNVIQMPFSSIEAKDLIAGDIIINESGEILNVDAIEMNENTYQINFSDSCNNEIVENFLPETVMGFIDNNEGHEINQFDEQIEIYEDSEKKVKLNKIMRGDVKKYKVYVKNDKGNVVKVNFGDPNMEIKRDNPARRRNFRARHHCENPGPRWKARYWACKTWSTKSVSSMLKEDKHNKAKNPKKWNSCLQQAKAKFDVYPSAYANAWAAKCYKQKGGKWKAVNEEIATNTMRSMENLVYNPNLWDRMNTK